MALQVAAEMPGIDQCLFKLIGANMNVTTDQAFVPVFGGAIPSSYLISAIRVLNARDASDATLSLDTAAGGVYNAISKPAGGILVAAAQAYSTLTGITLGLDLTKTALCNGPQSLNPYLSLTTGQGAASKADFYIFGRILTGV